MVRPFVKEAPSDHVGDRVNHLVGGCEERFRHLDAERRRLPVDNEPELTGSA